MAQMQTASSAAPGAFSRARFLVAKRIEELELAAERLESKLSDSTRDVETAGAELERLESRWHAVLRNLSRAEPGDVDSEFRALASARAEAAAADERRQDRREGLTGIRNELELLRSVYRSLDDLASASAPAEAGATRLRNTSRQVFQIIEEERMRIARDMHDGPAQSLANLVLQAEILERLITRDPELVMKELSDFKRGVRDVLDDTRRLIFDLRPMTLDDLGLVPTVRKFLKEFGERAGVITNLRVVGEETRLPSSLEPTLFRIIQEALSNARKHANASTVDVMINFQPHVVSAVVRDDGVGMDLSAVEAGLDGTRHLGLISMRERVELEKGRLQIKSAPGNGTEVRVSFDH